LPTAVHADGPLHDTASNVVKVLPPGTPKGTPDHVDPFHDSVIELPTAMHADGPLHDTPFRPSTLAGLGTTDHADPFHDSITVPTAAQKVELLQDTPLRELYCVGGVAGLGTTDHEMPALAWAPTGILATTIGTHATSKAGTNSLRALRPIASNRQYD
jgi:hypothetical protein